MGMMFHQRNDSPKDSNKAQEHLRRAWEHFSELGAQANLDKFPTDFSPGE
jgi:hypothetical protein